jgi:superfamily II DNA or RNA helicase
MTTQFITNQQKLLSDVVNNILPTSKNLYFLVGYFYFSGFEEIYKNVADKDLKVLAGLEIQHAIANKIKEFEIIHEVKASRGALRENFNKSLIQLFNDTDFFDSPEKREAFRIFLEKIKDGTLEIRKTLQPNHAKLYIFENKEEHSQGGEFPGTVITGSSNLTRSGLRDRFEINVISRDSINYKEAYTIFKQLWDEAVVIVDKNNVSDFLYNVIERIWVDKLPKPFLMYVRVLEEYFSLGEHDHLRLPGEITRDKFVNLKYQIDAIRKAIDIIHRHNGVIIADVVGLGKSIIASAIAHNLNLRTVVITPPHLRDQWEDYCFDFDYTAKIYTSGRIEKAVEENDESEQKLIIIDEAHKYRNELTADYSSLHRLCQRNKVVLLSATPFNNRPQDVFSMVKLFQLPTRSTIQTVDNLSFQFKKLVAEYKQIGKIQRAKKESLSTTAVRIKNVADEIRNILSPLVIRRSRLDLEAIEEYWSDLKSQNISFPKVNEPELLDYDLGHLSGLYEETLEKIAPDDEGESGFLGARYKPTSYIKDFEKYRKEIAEEMGVDENLLKQSQVNLADFMKRLLVRRFESSIFAFRSTLESIINSSKVVLDWYERLGKVPIYKKGQIPDVDSLLEATGEDLDEELTEAVLDEQLSGYIEKGLWFIDKKEIRKQFAEDIKKDIELLTEIHKTWFEDGVPEDPKLEHFAEILNTKLKEQPNRKIVVFSEFADTANYIYENIKDKFRLFKYTAKDATKTNKETIRQNFDAGYKVQVNDFDVLIATDAISEGFNLHRAGIVFNYDIPYNPTRVIQRVGRINRINKKVFDELFIYNFFPTATGERETHVKQISTLKIAMVHALFGEDTKVLTKDEELQSFFAEQFNRAISDQEELSPEAKYENYIRKLRASSPKIIEEALALPKRCRICRSIPRDRHGVLVFGKKGEEYAFKFGSKTQTPVNLPVAEALALFEAEITENPKPTTDAFEPVYEEVKDKLFSRKTEVAMDRGKQDTINKVEALKSKFPEKRDYLEDLLYVVKELDALPERFARFIRLVELKNLQEQVEQLQQQVPHSYLSSIIERERQIEEGKESLILSEELL